MVLGSYPDVPLALPGTATPRCAGCWLQALTNGTAESREDLRRGLQPKIPSAAIAGLWFDHWKDPEERPACGCDTADAWRANIFPLLGARPITEIEAPELVSMVKAIEARGAGDLAKRAMENRRTDFSLRYCPRIRKTQSGQ